MVFLWALGLLCRSAYHIHTRPLKLISEVLLIAIIIANGCSFLFFTIFQSFPSFLEQVQSFSLIVAVCHTTALANWERQGLWLYIWKPSTSIGTQQANKPTVSKRTYVCVSGVRNVCFPENVAYFVFSKHPFWDSPFCLITDEISDSKIPFLNHFLNLHFYCQDLSC